MAMGLRFLGSWAEFFKLLVRCLCLGAGQTSQLSMQLTTGAEGHSAESSMQRAQNLALVAMRLRSPKVVQTAIKNLSKWMPRVTLGIHFEGHGRSSWSPGATLKLCW
jgi:hypothetical protein